MKTSTQSKTATEMTDAELQAEMKRRKELKEADREAYKELTNEVVPSIMTVLKKASAVLQEVKVQAFTGVTGLLEMKDKAYGIKDDQRSHTFTTEKGDSITLGFRVRDGWDDTVGSGIAKVNKFLESLAKDEDSAKLVKIINKLLKKDAKGNLKSNRVVELHNLTKEYNSEDLTDGVNIIIDAFKPVQTCFFIEAATTDPAGKEENIPLSISSVEFPPNTKFDYFDKPDVKTED